MNLEFRNIEKEQSKPVVLDPAEEARRIMSQNYANAAKRQNFIEQRRELQQEQDRRIWER